MAVPILAAFVSSAAIYAGLAGVSIPVLIHLLSKRRFRRIRWAAMDFLLEAERRNRRRVRMEQLILLGLRCLAMLLIGLLLARWYMPPRGLAAMLGGTVRTERVVLLDDSFSMGYRTDRGTLFDAGKDAVLRLTQWLQQTAPQDSLTIVLASRPEQPVVHALRLAETGADELRSQLDGLKPSEQGGCVRPGLVAVRKRLDAQPQTINAALYVVSNFQAVDWLRTPGATGDAPDDEVSGGLLSALADWPGERRTLQVLLLDVGVTDASNTCVSSFSADQPQVVAGVPARFLAKITNYGRGDANVESLRVYVGEASQPPIPVPTIRPGQTLGVPVELTLPSPGPTSVTVELPDDRLLIDNRRHLDVDVQRAIRVLLVNGQSEAGTARDTTPLLAVALRPEGPVYSGNEVEIIDENALDDVNIAAYHVVILANVFRLTEPSATQLERFAQAGGGVVFFLGNQVDPDLYNRLLYRGGAGLLPARLGETIEAARTDAGFRFVDPDFTHPLLRHFAGADVPSFDGILTREFIACAAAGAMSRPAASAPTTTPTTGPTEQAPARVLLSFDDPDRHPAVIERIFGRGHAVLVTTTADKEWTNFPDWFTYVAMMQDMVQYIARPGNASMTQSGFLVGTPIRLQLEPGRFDPQATVRTPAFPEEPEATLEANPDGPEGTVQLVWSDTRRSGIYRFGLREAGGQTATRLAAVNVDARQSNLAHCDEQALRRSAAGLPITYMRSGEIIRDDSADARHDMWPAVLVVLAAVLLAESALAWWFGARTG